MDMQTPSAARPGITLVVPNYNHARYLPESLGSIAAQTHPPDQVLIIDDASTDDSLAVIARFIAENPTWKLIRHDTNQGVVPGQNEAIRTVDTEWIGFLGADDALHPAYLERAAAQAAQFPDAGLICACCEIIDGSDKRKLRPMMLPATDAGFLSPGDVRNILLAGDNYFSGTVTLFRRDAIKALGGFDASLGSVADSLLARQLALSYGFGFIPEILGYWRIHGHNYSITSASEPTALSARIAEVRARIESGNLFPAGYAEMFERRMRFGSARQVIAGDLPADAKAARTAALLGSGSAEGKWLALLLACGRLGHLAALAWVTLRMRPMSLPRLLSQFRRRRAIIAARSVYRSPAPFPRVPLASLRHRLNREVASPAIKAAVTPQSSAAGRNPLARLTGLAFQLYAFLSARRRQMLPVTAFASTQIDRLFITGPFGARVVRFADRQLAAGRTWLARPAIRLITIALAASAQVHLAASRKPSALRAVRLLNLIQRGQIRARRGLACNVYFSTLALCSAYDSILSEVPRTEPIDSFPINFAVGVAHMYRGSYPAALHFLGAASANGDSNALRKLGCVHILMGDQTRAAKCFAASVARDPHSVMSHQNNAAGYNPAAYTPSAWELENAGQLLIYDNLIQLGENFYHQGRYEDTFRCYQKALDHQDALARIWSVPDTLVQRIRAACPGFKPDLPVRLLGYEWVTLIGHIGSLDCHLRMVEMGLLPRANYVLLAPPSKVVNQSFLSLLAPHLCIIDDQVLVDDLLPYQRLVGDQFIAVRGDGPLAEPWTHAAARAQVAWADAGRGPLVAVPEDLRARGRTRLREAGVTADWFVALHIREGGYHGDGPGTTRQHRSANVADYLDAIAEITRRGGAVVRLGDKSMTPLRDLPGVFDYAHSEIKSQEMDLFLCAEARLFVGTTSGLTGAVQFLGTPMLLVNCSSNDCQFWHDKTDFTLRPVYDRRAGRYLSLRETYRQPLQALLIDGAVLARRGLEIHANRPQDIVAAVRYTLDCMDGKQRHLREGGALLDRYRAAMAENPLNFGAALPVPDFLKAYPALLDPV